MDKYRAKIYGLSTLDHILRNRRELHATEAELSAMAVESKQTGDIVTVVAKKPGHIMAVAQAFPAHFLT
ncbi:MAG: hypothetical protein U9R24_00320 [Thermodesulfobacteriota bacterium]|nr:hypothetical protein [Thermodesulfobacteriota bacterium]